ncbi:MAG: serine/threonine protein kinase, partial [Phycisphaerales bacterium]|nr:serine/threonine protein kinase [Phycisphaerales bacterium]
HEGVPYIVMEYIDGPSLRDIVRKRGPLDPRAVVPIARRMCEAVAVLHDGAIVHRDIKPGNVMITLDGRVVVTDFGLTCDRPYGTIGERMERVAGTPAYMAPEMFEGAVSTRTDVFALGVTIFELVTGRHPFGDSFSSIRAALEADEPEIDLQGVPEELAEIIRRATRKNPLYRFKNARRMFEALEALPARDYSGHNLVGLADVSREMGGDADSDDGSTSTYYDTISRLAERHKKVRDPEAPTARDGDAPEGAGLTLNFPCRRCGTGLAGVEPTGRCESCGFPVRESVEGTFLARGSAARIRGLWRTVMIIRTLTTLVPYTLWCAEQGGTAASVGASASVLLLGTQVGASGMMVRACTRGAREPLLATAAVIHLIIHLLTACMVAVTAFAVSPEASLLRPAATAATFVMVLGCFLATGATMGIIRGMDRRGVVGRKPGYDIWLVVLGLPGPVLLGYGTGLLMQRAVSDEGLAAVVMLGALIITGATMGAWTFAALMLSGAMRTVNGFLRLARRREDRDQPAATSGL